MNYLANYFYYLEHNHITNWLAFALLVVIIVTIIAIPRAYYALNVKERSSFLLIAALAWVPPILLLVASLPPLRSSFVERYLVPAVIALSIFLAVVLIVGTRKWRPILRAIPILLVIGMMIVGITNVYRYGNFNKNTNMHILARQLVEEVHKTAPIGTPIVANAPWIFYEAAGYATEDYPIYFIDENTDYIYGSLEMLRENDQHKIKDIEAFEENHPTIWYIGTTEDEDVAPFDSSWKKLQTISIKDDITGDTVFKATEYDVSAE